MIKEASNDFHSTVSMAEVTSNLNCRALEEEVCGLDAELDELQRLQDMTEDAETHEDIDHNIDVNGTNEECGPLSGEAADQDEVDRRSIHVGNVDYASTPQDLQDYFKSCGQINRITIMVDKLTGHPKGYAYIEFAKEDSVQNAFLLSDTLFKERQIKVTAKRRNVPGFNRGRGGFRGRPSLRSRGRSRGYRPFYRARGGFGRGYGRPY